MARTEAFLAALDAGARPDALDELLAAVERKEGAEAHVRCVDAWAQKLVRDDAAPEDVHWIRARLAMALEHAAIARGPRAPEFALEALRLHTELLEDPDGKERVAAMALTLTSSDTDRVFVAVDAVGGLDEAIDLMRRHVKTPEVKSEPLQVAQVRRAISHLHALIGDHEAAFFESLKVLRKAPFEPLYVDESLTLAAQTERNKELSLVLQDLAKDESLPARIRASMYNKVGHLLERDLDDLPAALDAYVASLRLTPDAKGPRRHARRLAAEIGVEFEMPAPAPEATVDQPTPDSLLAWSSKDLSATGAAVDEGERTQAVVPQGEFSSSQSKLPENDAPESNTPLSDDGAPIGEPVSADETELLVDGSEEDAPPALPSDLPPDGFGEDTVQLGTDDSPTEAAPPRAPRAITIPGAAPPDAPTALELEGSDTPEAKRPRPVSVEGEAIGPPIPPLPADADESGESTTSPLAEPDDGTVDVAASDVVAETDVNVDGPQNLEPSSSDEASEIFARNDALPFDTPDESGDQVQEPEVVDNIGGGATLADVPAPSFPPDAQDEEKAEADLEPVAPGGLSATGVPLDALKSLAPDEADVFASVERSGVFSTPPASAAEDTESAKSDKDASVVDAPSVSELNLDAIAADAVASGEIDQSTPATAPLNVEDADAASAVEDGAGGARHEMTDRAPRPKMTAGPSLASASSAQSEAVDDRQNQEGAPKLSRRKRKKREKKKKRQQSKKISDALLPGMRPEDLLPNRLASSPGRRSPSQEGKTIRTASDAELPLPDDGSENVEATIAEPAPQPPTAASRPTNRRPPLSLHADMASDEPPTSLDSQEAQSENAEDAEDKDASLVEDRASESESGADLESVSSSTSSKSDAPIESASVDNDDAPVVAAKAVDVPVRTEDLIEEALEAADANACIDLAQQVLGAADGSDGALRLATRALMLELASGLPSDDAKAVFLSAMSGHEEEALAAALEMKHALDGDAPLLTAFFVDISNQAGHWAGSAELLGSLALVDAPNGLAFERLDAFFVEREEDEERLQLWARARQAANDADARRALDKGRLHQLKSLGQQEQWRSLHADCALEDPRDESVRSAALAAWETAPAKDRARFLGRLALALEGDDVAIDLYRQTLGLRLETRDDLGAEAAARELLKVRPGDREALEALTEVLGRSAHRSADLAEVLRTRRLIGSNTKDFAEVTRAAEALFSLFSGEEDDAAAFEEFEAAVMSAPAHLPLVTKYIALLKDAGRWRALLSIIDTVAPDIGDDAVRTNLWVEAAEVAHRELDDIPLARERVEFALEITPRDTRALTLRADLASADGDPEGAYQALERLAGEVDAGPDRASIHLRMGFLLEDDLHRPEDALKRYRAAADVHQDAGEALAALRALALKHDASEHVVFALRGLIRLETVTRLRSVLRKQLAEHLLKMAEVDEAKDVLGRVLEDDALDAQARESLIDMLASEEGYPDAEAAYATPSDQFVDVVIDHLAPLTAVEAAIAKEEFPFGLRRVLALAFVRQDEDIRARGAFERLLDDEPTDAVCLKTLAELLAKLETDDAKERQLGLLEQLLLHHGPTLAEAEQVQTWAAVCLLRRDRGQPAGALKAARRALALAIDDDLRGAIPTPAAEAAIAVLEHGPEPSDARLLISAHRLLAGREPQEAAAERLAEAAAAAEEKLEDKALARQLLEDAVAYAPQLRAPREALLQLDIREGDPDKAIATTESLLASEGDAHRRAGHHLRLSKLYLRAREDPKSAAEHLRKAIELDPDNATALDDAEVLFSEQEDAEGLAALYAAQLSSLPKDRSASRYQLLERLAQVRRYDLRDLAGAAEALEAMGAIDPHALKPREDAARIYAELGRSKDATRAWRAVLERDPVHVDGWRGLSALYARTEQPDETFCVAATMAAVELADDDVVRAVRLARAPFPKWPKVPGDRSSLRQRLSHELERAPVRSVFDVCGRRLFRALAKPLKEFGIRKKDHLSERDVPGSVNLAVRVTSQLMGLREPPKLVRAALGSTDGAPPPFALLPTPEPGLIVTDDVIRGGMTPERAFALGRAMAWLTPHGLVAGTLDTAHLRTVLNALVHLYLPASEVEDDGQEVRDLAKTLQTRLEKGLGTQDVTALRRAIADALRGYIHARKQRPLSDFVAGIGYTGDRLGYLLCGDLTPSFRVLQQAGGTNDVLGSRLAIKELVLFGISPEFLSLRRDMGLALSAKEASALYDLL